MYPCEMKNSLFVEQALGSVPQRVNFFLGDVWWGGHARVPLTSTSELVSFVDILTDYVGAVIPKPHDLGFCFIATASTHKEFYGLMFAPQTNPASPAVFMYRNSIEEFLCRFDSRDAISLPHPLFPVYRFFFPVAKHRKLWC